LDIVRKFLRKKLQCHVPLQLEILGLLDDACAAAWFFDYAVVSDGLSGRD
jgi:hypothetical protein